MWPGVWGGKGRNYGGEELPVRKSKKPLVGYRSWLIQPDLLGQYILHSLHVDYIWETESEARCNIHSGGVPDPKCLCGLYSQLPDHPLTEWDHMTRGRVYGSGTVILTGRVIRCDAGFKAEKARIQSPVVVGVECSGYHSCDQDVVKIQLPPDRPLFFGLCGEHAGIEGRLPEPAPMVDASVWMGEACRRLETRYPQLEFISWIGEEV